VHCHLARVPVPAHVANPAVPVILGELVNRLMAKDAEDRYQSAFAVAEDLETALDFLRERGRVVDFPLGRGDLSDRFALPQKLYGREAERATLLQAFDRVAAGGRELLLVAGYSGIGKSALVHEVHRPIAERRGQFVEGKFDQFNRNIPYASLIQAFRELARQLLTEPVDLLAAWRQRVQEALGPNGQVVVDVIPEIELIVGAQPAVPELGAAEALNRFNVVFESFVRAFASAEHPLALFLDDLQWADLASLNLVKRFMTDPENRHILLIGAYRDNEVGQGHPLLLTLEEMRRAGASVGTISLPPLAPEHVAQLLADTLRRPVEEVGDLCQLCVSRTGGNPFFLNQFLLALYEGRSIDFDPKARRWTWDMARIEAMGITDNVVELMARKIRSLDEAVQGSLRTAAALGASFDLRTLSIAMETRPLLAARAIQPSLEEGLVVPIGSGWKFVDGGLDPASSQPVEKPSTVQYRFLHDRVQQAAYSLLGEGERTALHGRIGRRLLTALSPEERHDRLFEILGHLDREGGERTGAERHQLARLNREAGERAKASAAFRPALTYLQRGLALAGDDVWDQDYELALALHTHATEAAYQTADYDLMERFAAVVHERAATKLDRIRTVETRIQAYISQNRLPEAVDSALALLAELGVTFPDEPTEGDVIAAIGAVAGAIAGRTPEQLYAADEMQDPEKLAAMRVLQKITSATYVARPALFPLVPMKGVELSATLGNTAASTYAYACYGIILAGVVGDIPGAYGMGQLAVRLVDRFSAREYEARTRYIDACYVRHWCRPASETWRDFPPTYRIGLDTGDLEFAGWALMMGSFHAFYSGRPLSETEPETARWIAAIAQVKHEPALQYTRAGWQAMRCLRGLNPSPTRLADEEGDYDPDARLQAHIDASDAFGVANLLFNRMLLHTLFGQFQEAEALSAELDPWFPSMVATIHVPTVVLIDAVFRAEVARGDEARRDELLARAEADLAQLATWAQHAPMNHGAKERIAAGEIAWARGDLSAARAHLKAATAIAAQNENLLEEAFAHELLGRLWIEAEHEAEMGHGVLRRAHQLYSLWGAAAKAHDLSDRYGEAVVSGRRPAAAASQGATLRATTTSQEGTGGLIDLTSVLKANQALSGEVVLSRLLGTMMDIVLENGGAQYGALLLDSDGKLRLEARDVAATPGVTVLESMPLAEAIEHRLVPGSIVHYCARMREAVVLDDATDGSRFAQDPYVREKETRSVLCQALVHQGKLVGVLYLENSLSSGAFTADRLEVLDLLCGQAAVALVNARLFDQQTRLAASFQRFVPRQFLQHLGRKGILDIRLGDSVREEFTVLFSDLRGFTSLSESLSAEDNFALLNRYLARMEPLIETHGGFIDKYIGDAIMALFPGDPADAVRAAVAMQQALRTFNDEREAAGEEALHMGIGLHTGRLMLGTVGSEARMETTVIGDTVNLASRLEGLTKHYDARVLISEDTRRAMIEPADVHLRAVGRVRVRGKSESVFVHEVLDGEAPGVRDRKREQLVTFDVARDAYFAGHWEAAREGFEVVLDAVPEDGSARYYLARTLSQLSGDGTLLSIDGVEVLETK
jgi:predicted ATPase/class 3 adenylate cyclase